jgi:hypothetical protein
MEASEISRQSMHDVLRHLSRSCDPGPTPLAGLLVVRQGLATEGVAPEDQALRFELARLVIEVVESELQRLRRQVGLAEAPALTWPPEEALQADFSRGNRELESWSALYHLYLRPDLDLTLHRLVRLLGDGHRRTVQRRLQRGVTALTQRMQERERRARMAARRERLAEHLPGQTAGRLFGRSTLLEHLVALVLRPEPEGIVALRGPGGIGKTAAADAVARHVLEQGQVEGLVWLTSRRAFPGAGEDPAGRARDGAELAAAAWLEARPPAGRQGGRRRLIVLDGLDEPAVAASALRWLQRAGGRDGILVTGRVGWSAFPGVRVVDITPLPRRPSLELLRHAARRLGLLDVAEAGDGVLEPVVAATAGHPLALQLVAARLRTVDVGVAAEEFRAGTGSAAGLYADLWAEAWEAAGADAREAVRAVLAVRRAGRPADGAAIGALAGLEADRVGLALAEAVDAGLLVPSGGAAARHYQTALFLRRYLRPHDREGVDSRAGPVL